MPLEQARLITCSILLGVLGIVATRLGWKYCLTAELPQHWRRCRKHLVRGCYVSLVLVVILFLTYSGLVLEQCIQENHKFPSFDDLWGWLFVILFVRLLTMILPERTVSFGLYSLLASAATYLHLQIGYALKTRSRYEELGIKEDPVLDRFNYYRGPARAFALTGNQLTLHWVLDAEDFGPECYSNIEITCPMSDIPVARTNGTCADIQRAIAESQSSSSEDLSSGVPWTLIFGHWPTCDAQYLRPEVFRYWKAYAYTDAFEPRLAFYLALSVFLALTVFVLWYRKRKRLTVVGAVTSDPEGPHRAPALPIAQAQRDPVEEAPLAQEERIRAAPEVEHQNNNEPEAIDDQGAADGGAGSNNA